MGEGIMFDNGSMSYEGDNYIADVRFMYKFGSVENGISLSYTHIEDIELKTSVDRLYSSGFVVYRDVVGDVSKIIGVFGVLCQVTLIQLNRDADGNETPDSENVFSHTFLVDNIEIVSNDRNSMTYCIHLTGYEYLGLMNSVQFSNYGGKQDLIEIAQHLLKEHGKLNTDSTFSTTVSGVKLEYITNGNDTVMTALDYVMQKQFFDPEATDAAFKLITYDMVKNVYGVFQIGRDSYKKGYLLYMSLNNTQLNEFIQQDLVQVASRSDMRKSEIIQKISPINIRTYDFDENLFSQSKQSMSKIADFCNCGSKNGRIQPMEVAGYTNMQRNVSEWANDTNVYTDAVRMFMDWDSVVVNTGGVAVRKLMEVVTLAVDNRAEMTRDDSTESMDENLERYRQLQGGWFISGIHHIIKPILGTYTQNLQLSRTNNV